MASLFGPIIVITHLYVLKFEEQAAGIRLMSCEQKNFALSSQLKAQNYF